MKGIPKVRVQIKRHPGGGVIEVQTGTERFSVTAFKTQREGTKKLHLMGGNWYISPDHKQLLREVHVIQ